MYRRNSRQRDGPWLRIADHDHALCLPELDPVDRDPGRRRHRELHAATRRLVARLLHHAATACTTTLITELRRELMDRREARPGRNVTGKRREVHGLYLKPTFSRLRALAIR